MTSNINSGPVPPEFYSVRQTAGILGINYITAKRAVLRGDIPTLKLGARRLVPVRWVEQAIHDALDAKSVSHKTGQLNSVEASGERTGGFLAIPAETTYANE